MINPPIKIVGHNHDHVLGFTEKEWKRLKQLYAEWQDTPIEEECEQIAQRIFEKLIKPKLT